MIKLFYTRLLSFVCLITTVLFFAACEKNKDVDSNKIQLISFGPTGAKHGDTIRFFGNNLNKVTSIQFAGTNAIVEQKDFKQQTQELILLLVPNSAEKGYVTLKTPEGDIVSKTQFNLKVVATVSAVAPPQARPGENITITGNFLNWVNRITFARDKVVTVFVSKTLTQLVVKVPDDAQTGPLILSYQGTDSSFVQTTDTLKVTLPISTAFSPNPVKHNTNLTITGTNLDLVKQVLFTGASKPTTSFVSQSATQLVVKVDSATVKGKVTLVAASGASTVSTTDLDVAMPTISTMLPSPVAPASNVTITGTNLDLVKNVSFTGVINAVTSFVSQSATQLVVTVPTGSVTGKITLGVINTGQTVKSANDLPIIGSSVPPIIIYDDAVTSAWNGWIGGGWGGTKDLNNTSPVRAGSKSVAINYVGDWGVPLQLGGANISLGGYTSLKVSIYGGAGSNGKNVNVGFNEQDGKTIAIVEGQWTDFTIPLSQISATSTLTHLYIKKYTAGTDFTIYVDNLGVY
jgi:IPT/TIG domain